MTPDDIRRIAHRRALMLGSSAFPPIAHVPFLEDHGPHLGAGLGRHQVDDLVLRDVALPAEQPEVVRVISETLIKFSPQGRTGDPRGVNTVPAGILSASPVWFGLERAGRLDGLHGGFFWGERLWIRRFYSLVHDDVPWATHYRIESQIYGHLWDLGMREAMIQIPVGTPNLEARRAAGWQDSHEVHFQWNARPFMWLRKAFSERPVVPDPDHGRPSLPPDWQHRDGRFITRELRGDDETVAQSLLANAAAGCRCAPQEARIAWFRWRTECTVIGTFDREGALVAMRVYDRPDSETVRQRASIFAEAAMTERGLAPAVRRAAVAFGRQIGISRIVVSPITSVGGAQILRDYGVEITRDSTGQRQAMLELSTLEARARDDN